MTPAKTDSQHANRQGATCWLGMALTVTRMYLAEQLEG